MLTSRNNSLTSRPRTTESHVAAIRIGVWAIEGAISVLLPYWMAYSSYNSRASRQVDAYNEMDTGDFGQMQVESKLGAVYCKMNRFSLTCGVYATSGFASQASYFNQNPPG